MKVVVAEARPQSSINLDEELLEVPPQTQNNHVSEPVEQENLLEKSQKQSSHATKSSLSSVKEFVVEAEMLTTQQLVEQSYNYRNGEYGGILNRFSKRYSVIQD